MSNPDPGTCYLTGCDESVQWPEGVQEVYCSRQCARLDQEGRYA